MSSEPRPELAAAGERPVEGLASPPRLAALYRTDLLDTGAEEAFDRLTRLATTTLDVPVALVSLVDGRRQFFKSCVGLTGAVACTRETPLTHSFCKHVVETGRRLVVADASENATVKDNLAGPVPDAREHATLKDNLAVPDLGVVAYAGMPLVGPGGHVLGSFCAIDTEPRHWSSRDLDVLGDLAASITTEISLREDIRERERTERELSQLRVQQESILQSAGEGIFGVALDGRLTFVNPAAEKMLGWSSAELVGRVQHDVVHHTTADGAPYPRERCPIYRALLDGGQRTGGELFWRRDGSSFPIEFTSTPLWEGERRRGAVVVFRDVSERRREERRASARHAVTRVLSESPSLSDSLERAFEALARPLGLKLVAGWMPDEHSGGLVCRTLWADPSLGARAGDDMGGGLVLGPWEELPGRAWSTRRAAWTEDMAGETHSVRVRAAERLGLRGGVCVPVLSGHTCLGLLECVSAETGPPEPGLVETLSSIAAQLGQHVQRVRAEQHRSRIEELLARSQRLESLGQLAGGIAHDFNNLLAVILNYASFLAGQVEEGSIRDDIEEIRSAAERAAELTRRLLLFGRREVPSTELVRMEEVLSSLEAMLGRTIGEQIRLRISSARDLSPVRVDRAELEQVVLNLILNARDAMPDGGALTVAASELELDEQESRRRGLASRGRYVRLVVSDSGRGMSPEVAARAFEPFFTTKPKGRGTGLGLPTAYGTVSDYGGHIDLDSERGRGTTMTVYLPAALDAAVEEPPEAADRVPMRAAVTARVLLVEDEDAVRAVAGRILSAHGYAVVEAKDGDEALLRHRDAGPPVGVVLTDVVMPGMSGEELVARLRERDPGLPAVYMSGYAEGLAVDGGLAEDGIRLVEKPFDAATLLDAVGAALVASPST